VAGMVDMTAIKAAGKGRGNCSFIVSSIVVKHLGTHWGIPIDASLSHNLKETHYDFKICLKNVVFAKLSIFEGDLLVLANYRLGPVIIILP
jgi:hypothetical protein